MSLNLLSVHSTCQWNHTHFLQSLTFARPHLKRLDRKIGIVKGEDADDASVKAPQHHRAGQTG
jgi:hypothetical protein